MWVKVPTGVKNYLCKNLHYLFIYLVCMYVSAQAKDMVCMWRLEDSLQMSVHSSQVWVLGIELRTSGLVASASASLPTCLQPHSKLKEEIIYCASWFHKLQSIVPGLLISIHLTKKDITAAKSWDRQTKLIDGTRVADEKQTVKREPGNKMRLISSCQPLYLQKSNTS